MSSYQENPRDSMPITLYRAYAVCTFICMTFLIWLVFGREGSLEPHQMLVAGEPSLEGFLTHQLFHTSGIHLLLNMLVIFVAGGILESYWGTSRFLAFSFFVAGGVALMSLGIGKAAIELGLLSSESAVSYGASGVALGCLVCMAVAFPRNYIVRGVSIRHAVWAILFSGAAGLILLDSWTPASGEVSPGSFLVSQITGIGIALFYVWAEPRVRIYRRSLAVKHQVRQKEKVQEIRKRVDQLLDKIHDLGYDRLTPAEKSFLKQASKHYKQEK